MRMVSLHRSTTLIFNLHNDDLRNVISYLDIRDVFRLGTTGDERLSSAVLRNGIVERLCFESPMADNTESSAACAKCQPPPFFFENNFTSTGIKHLEWLWTAPCGNISPTTLIGKHMPALRSLSVDAKNIWMPDIFSLLSSDGGKNSSHLESLRLVWRHCERFNGHIKLFFPAIPFVNLTNLEVFGFERMVFKLSNLPQTLTSFHGSGIIVGINNASYARKRSLSFKNDGTVKFPPTLLSLNFTFLFDAGDDFGNDVEWVTDIAALFESLPEGLIDLNVVAECIPVNTPLTKLLPRTLRNLTVDFIIHRDSGGKDWLQIEDLPPLLESLMCQEQPLIVGSVVLPLSLTYLEFDKPFDSSKWPNVVYPRSGLLRIGNVDISNITDQSVNENVRNMFSTISRSIVCDQMELTPKNCVTLSLSQFSSSHIPKLHLLPITIHTLRVNFLLTPDILALSDTCFGVLTKLPKNLTSLEIYNGIVLDMKYGDLASMLPNLKHLTLLYDNSQGRPIFSPISLPSSLQSLELIRTSVDVGHLTSLLSGNFSLLRITYGNVIPSDVFASPSTLNNIGSQSRNGWMLTINHTYELVPHSETHALMLQNLCEMIVNASGHLRRIIATVENRKLFFTKSFYKRRLNLASSSKVTN